MLRQLIIFDSVHDRPDQTLAASVEALAPFVYSVF